MTSVSVRSPITCWLLLLSNDVLADDVSPMVWSKLASSSDKRKPSMKQSYSQCKQFTTSGYQAITMDPTGERDSTRLARHTEVVASDAAIAFICVTQHKSSAKLEQVATRDAPQTSDAEGEDYRLATGGDGADEKKAER